MHTSHGQIAAPTWSRCSLAQHQTVVVAIAISMPMSSNASVLYEVETCFSRVLGQNSHPTSDFMSTAGVYSVAAAAAAAAQRETAPTVRRFNFLSLKVTFCQSRCPRLARSKVLGNPTRGFITALLLPPTNSPGPFHIASHSLSFDLLRPPFSPTTIHLNKPPNCSKSES